MKNHWTLITGIVFGLSVLLLFFSNIIAPLSVEHGINVGYAKDMIQGLMPYHDMPMKESPIGIVILGLLYTILGVEASSYWASCLLCITNIFNLWLMYKLMNRMHIKGAPIWGALSFYLLMLYSSDGLMLRMEPFAIFFLLLTYWFILKRHKMSLVYAAICFVVAIGCKSQCIVLLPSLAIPAFWQGKHNHLSIEKGLLFCITTLTLGVISFIAIAWICGNANWWENLGWNFTSPSQFQTYYDVIYTKFTYFIIQSGRCSLFFFIFFLFIWKKLNGYGKQGAIIGILACVGGISLLCWDFEVAYFIISYPFIAMALAHLMKVIERPHVAGLIWITVILIPVSLSIREYMKLKNGSLKKEQQEEIKALKNIVKAPGNTMVWFEECYEYELGPQIFTEIPQLKKTNIHGDNQWKELDYIILNEEGFSNISYSSFSDDFFEAITEMKSYGTGKLIIYSKQ